MLAESTAVYLGTAGLMLLAIIGFIWAASRDQLRGGPEQAMVIFDDGDLSLQRDWETETQRAERRLRYGEPQPPRPGQWGGA